MCNNGIIKCSGLHLSNKVFFHKLKRGNNTSQVQSESIDFRICNLRMVNHHKQIVLYSICRRFLIDRVLFPKIFAFSLLYIQISTTSKFTNYIFIRKFYITQENNNLLSLFENKKLEKYRERIYFLDQVIKLHIQSI